MPMSYTAVERGSSNHIKRLRSGCRLFTLFKPRSVPGWTVGSVLEIFYDMLDEELYEITYFS